MFFEQLLTRIEIADFVKFIFQRNSERERDLILSESFSFVSLEDFLIISLGSKRESMINAFSIKEQNKIDLEGIICVAGKAPQWILFYINNS